MFGTFYLWPEKQKVRKFITKFCVRCVPNRTHLFCLCLYAKFMQVSEQGRVESWTDPLAGCEDSSSWCWVLVRPEASPPELAVPGFHYSLHPAGGDSVRQRGLRRRKKQTWAFSYMTPFLTSSIRSLALPISSGMDTSLLLHTRRTLRGRLNKYFGKTDSRFRLWRKIKHWHYSGMTEHAPANIWSLGKEFQQIGKCVSC